MRKLNQNELQSLACRLYQNLCKMAQAAQDKLNARQDKANAPKAMEMVKAVRAFDQHFKSLPKDVREYIAKNYSYHPKWGNFVKDVDPESIVKKMRKDQTTVTVPADPRYERYSGELFCELTVAQIDSDNVDDMLNKAARRYVKTPGAGATV